METNAEARAGVNRVALQASHPKKCSKLLELRPEGNGGICRVARHLLRRIELRRRIIEKIEAEFRCEELRPLLPIRCGCSHD